MHLNDEALRAWLDHEYADGAGAENHLATCVECRRRLDEVQARAERVQGHFASLAPATAVSPDLALKTFQRRAATRAEGPSMLKRIFSKQWRPAWIGLSIIAVLTVAFSLPPVRAWASDVLAQFRVQKITVVQIDNTRMTELIGNTALAKQIGQLVSDSINVSQEPGKPQVVADAAAASKLAGFTVRLPSSRTDKPEISVQGSAAFDFVVNRQRAQTLLNEAGAKNIQLPASLDGAKIAVDIPAGVSVAYGDCPKLGDENRPGSGARRFANCTMLVEIPSPTVDTPPDLDVKQLAQLGLEFTGMPHDQAVAFSQKVDWTSTLVIPVPRNGATYKELTVDGTTGYLIQRPADDVPQYVVVWVKNGIIHAVGGFGADTSNALSMANSLR